MRMSKLNPLQERDHQRSEQLASHFHVAKLVCFWTAILVFLFFVGVWICDFVDYMPLSAQKRVFLNGVITGSIATLVASVFKPS